MKYIATTILLSLLLLSCENENESIYEEVKQDIDTTHVESNYLASFSFQGNILDNSGKAFPIYFPGTPTYKKSSAADSALFIDLDNFVQFMMPKADTFSFSFFMKGNKNVPINGATILELQHNSILELDATSGATKISLEKNVQSDDLNTYKNWLFVYIEIVKNNTSAKVFIRNKESSEDKSFHYTLPLKAPFDSGEMIRIGNSFSNQNGFRGIIDELKMYNRSLSLSELESIYNNL